MKYHKNLIKNIILVLCILVVLLVLVFTLGDVKAIVHAILNDSYPIWLLATLGLLILYCCLNQISIVFLTRQKYRDISRADLFCIAGSEYFFNGVTPFSTGGQPFQIYALRQKGVKVSDSTSILLLNFISYQVVMNVISVFSVSFFYPELSKDVPNLSKLVFIGFGVNLAVLIFLLLLGTTKFMGRGVTALLEFSARIPLLRKLTCNSKDKFNVYVSEMQTAFQMMGKRKRVWLVSAITKALSLLCYYSIPFFAFMTIGINMGWENYIYTVAVTSFTLTLTAWIPTPGASGGAELAFTTLFLGLLTVEGQAASFTSAETMALSGMLVWRFFTYYLLMILGLIMYIIFDRRNAKVLPQTE